MAAIAVDVSDSMLEAAAQEFDGLLPAEQVEELRSFVTLVRSGECDTHPFYDYLTSGLFATDNPFVASALDLTIATCTGVSPDIAARKLIQAGGDLEIAVELCVTIGLAKGRLH